MPLTFGIRRRAVACAAALWCFSPVAWADSGISEKAREYFNAGVSYMQDPDGARYEDAYREFKAAYAESPSWKILGNLGIVAMKLERDGEAIDAIKKYLAEGKNELDAAERAQFERDLSTLSASVVTLEIGKTPPGAQIVDERLPTQGQPIRNVYDAAGPKLSLGVHAGHHRLTARLSGYAEQVWELDARPGATESHEFQLQPAASAKPGISVEGPANRPADTLSRPIPTSVYIGLAATGAMAVGFGVTAVLAKGKQSDFSDKNDGSDPAGAQSLKDSGQRLNLIADVFLGAAVVAGGVTAVLYATRPSVPSGQGHRMRVTPTVGRGGGGLWLQGAF